MTEQTQTPPTETAHATHAHPQQTIIIKRIKKVKKGGHHGGAWKIAYADFVTAMMAFFLLMWLLASLNKYQREGISEYFQKSLREELQKKSSAKANPSSESNKISPQNQPKNQQSVKQSDDEILHTVKKDLEDQFKKDNTLNKFLAQLDIKMTQKGLKITLHDVKGKPLFLVGESQFEDYASPMLNFFGKYLNNLPYKIQIMGHTDVLPYDKPNYTNWELSADRANAMRRALIVNGLDQTKIRRIIGLSDTENYDNLDGDDPKNRRVEILILKPKKNLPSSAPTTTQTPIPKESELPPVPREKTEIAKK